ncbi:TPA: iron hydrogenase [Candidatus Falkowbacteria bacterium]|nr:iron hydrogenase [Candidatus Falkowbacteria bacterium]HAY12520.1 iron hydrogenase [Candidatus Falkowbacteria bacterium]HBI96726.1 iron hydrogenase [Candidatus Falkowbacteria bacterium]HBT27939.1 iron hydrogenase [Candidatus Falkowbacteria bacterium]HBY14680.1 iron hydrogenase [Candidatus Falkowbacteria bacterium]
MLTQERSLERVDVMSVARFLGIATASSLIPFYIHLQWLTGPLVNALLIIALFLIGIRSAMVLCVIPSLMALAGGLIPAVLAPVVPFIMLSNMLFVLCIDRLYSFFKNDNQGYWLGVAVGSFIKFIFLYFSVSFMSKLLIKQELAQKVAQMMSWPQLATALSGGLIAWAVLKWLKRI